MTGLKAVVWDVDGTLAETERDGHRVAFNLAFAEEGLAWGWDEARYGELLHVTGGRERLMADMVNRPDAPADEAGRLALAQRLHTRKNRYYEALVDQGMIAARSGVMALMREAAAAGVLQAIVTTTSRSNVVALMSRLLGARWDAMFATVVCGEDAQRKKPDPQAYELALHRLGLSADSALALEDSAPGMAAARAAGLRVWLRPSVYFPCTEMADPAVHLSAPADLPTLADLQTWFTHSRASLASAAL